LLASYRWRRRLLWLLAIAIVAGVVSALVIEFPSRSATEGEPVAKGHIEIAPDQVPKTVKLKGAARASALSVARLFVSTAVARKHIDRSWSLLSPEIKQGLTRKEFVSGNNSIVPYPVGDSRWAVDYSYRNRVGFQIALYPRPGAKLSPEVFLLDLRAAGTGKQRHWLVKAWNPTPIQAIGSSPTGGGNIIDSVRPQVASSGSSNGRLGVAWLLVPLGLLSLVLLVPLGFLLFNWRRGRAIERDYLRQQNARG
jgi:hypothetical protein